MKRTSFPGFLALVLTAINLWTAAVQAQFSYITNSGTITITSYYGPQGSVTIPDTINGLPVTVIGDSAFESSRGLASVTIPNSVTNIGDAAFADCTLTSLTIPNSVISIGPSAFYDCTNLTNVTIPNSVTWIGGAAFSGCLSLTNVTIRSTIITIGDGAFYYCTSLTAISVDTSNVNYSSVDGVLFNKDMRILLQCPAGKVGTYTIPNTVNELGGKAFFGCTGLTTVTIPNSVTNLGDYAFMNCTGLTSVTLPNSVTAIGGGTLFSCTSLTNVTIPSSVLSIGDSAFSGCTSLTNITIPKSVTDLGGWLFGYAGSLLCTSLKEVYFGGNAPSIAGGLDPFPAAPNATVYYLPGTLGWGTTFGSRPTALWVLPNPVILTGAPNFGTQTNVFGFTISWATNVPVVVEASASLNNPAWTPLTTNRLVNGTSYFGDHDWSNRLAYFYRVRKL